MKKTIYTLCAGVFALLTIIGCSKSDDNDSKKDKDKNDIEVTNFNIPKEAKAILPDKTLTEMVANGMTIHEGTNPPNIEGLNSFTPATPTIITLPKAIQLPIINISFMINKE